MGLDKLIEEVRRLGDEEASKILGTARAESEKIIANAEAEAKAIVDSGIAKAALDADKERMEALSKARIEAKKMVSEARSGIVGRHVEAAWKGLMALRGDQSYGVLMLSLAKAAEEELGPGCRLYCRKEDENLFGPIKPAGFIECSGGAIVEDKTGKIRVDSRIESLFGEQNDRLAAMVYASLFMGDD